MNKYLKPDFDKIGLITIDMQNDFSLSGAVAEVEGTNIVIPNMVKILKKFRQKGKIIIHIVRIYKENGSNVDICRKKSIEDGLKIVSPYGKGVEIVQELKPNDKKLDSDKLLNGEVQEMAPNEFVIYKPRWGAFYNTPLEDFLKRKNISTLVFTGCNFPNCPRTSIYEASERDFKLIAIEDAISGIYKRGITELKNIGCESMNTDQFITEIK